MKFLFFVYLLFAIVFVPFPSFAGFEGINGTTSLGIMNRVKCSTGTTCTRENKGVLVITASPSALTSPVVIGDGTAADAEINYDGNAQDYNISLDDSTDDLVIGLGTVPGTTDSIRIDENQDATFVQDILPLSTITGDGGAVIVGMLENVIQSSTVSTLTIAQCGSTVFADQADVVVLPEASTAKGCRYTFVCGTTSDLDIDPADATDFFTITGSITGANTTTVLAPSAGDALRCTDIGAGFSILAVANDVWAVTSTNGIITDVN